MKLYLIVILLIFSSVILHAQISFMTGDIAVVGLNANDTCGGITGTDLISFVCFKDITTGTTIDITDNGYERRFPGLWGDTEGTYRATRTGGTIPAGTVITFNRPGSFSCVYPDADWTFNSINGGWNQFNINSSGDQIYFMQGGVWSGYTDTIANNATYQGGNILFGFNTKTTWAANGTTQQSNLYPNMTCFSMTPTSGTDFVKYTGPMTATTQKAWITRISTQTNWTKYATCALYNSGLPNYTAGLTIGITEFFNVDAGTNDTVCQSQTAFTLSGQTPAGGFWSGTGITDANLGIFNPTTSGAGNFDVTYVYNDAGCPYHDIKTVVVRPMPVAAIIPATVEACVGANYNIGSSISSGTTPFAQLWSGDTQYINSTSILNPVFNSPIVGNYNLLLTVTDSKGCIGIKSLPVHVNANPTATISPVTLDVCVNVGANLTAIPVGGSSIYSVHQWTGNTSILTGTINQPNVTVNSSIAGSYNLAYTVTDNKGCKGTSAVPVSIKPNPVLTVTPTSPSVCSGFATNVALNSDIVGTTYNWTVNQSGVTGAAIGNLSPISQVLTCIGASAGTATYSVTPTANSCIGSIVNVVVSVNPQPVAYNVSGGGTMCSGYIGYPVVLSNSQAGVNYQLLLNGNPLGAAISGTGSLLTWALQTVAGTYTIVATNTVTTCQRPMSGSATISLYSNPVADAGNDVSIPSGTNTTLNGSANGGIAPYTYSWTPSGLLINAGIASPTTNNLTSTATFILTVSDDNTCTSIDTVIVTVTGSTLSVNATSTELAVCAGGTVHLQATGSGGSGNYTYAWSSNTSAFTSTSASPFNIPTTSTIYTVVVNDGFNPPASSTVSVVVNSLPVVVLSSISPAVCSGSQTNVNASASTGYNPLSFAWDNGLGAGAVHTIYPTNNNLYSVTVTDGHNCQNTGNISVISYLLPTVDAGLDKNVCMNTSTSLVATGIGGTSPYTFNWDHSIGAGQNQNVIVNSNATYYVTVTDAHNCTGKDSVKISLFPDPSVDAGVNDTICKGESALISATGSVGQYQWNNAIGSGLQHSVSPTINTYYTVTITDGNTCTKKDSVLIFVNPLPVANAGANASICCGKSTTLNASASTGAMPLSYSWNNGMGSGVAKMVNPIIPTTYIVSVTDANLCSDTAAVIITVNSNPVAEAGADTSACKGSMLNLNAENSLGGSSYLWSNGSNSAIISVSSSVTSHYYVTVSNSFNCIDFDSVKVTVLNLPDISVSTKSTSCDGNTDGTAQLAVSSNASPYTYNWSTGDTSVAIKGLAAGIYFVTVTDKNHCKNTDTAEVKNNFDRLCLDIPSAFTPNNDDNNDTWKIKNIGLYTGVVVEIYNRWGSLVFKSDGYTEPWDGKFKGSEVSAGSYVYLITINGGAEKFDGTVTIIR